MRQHQEGPRRKKWCASLEREIQAALFEEPATLKRIIQGQGTPDNCEGIANNKGSPWKKLKAQLSYEGRGKLRFGLNKDDDIWEEIWMLESESEGQGNTTSINILKPSGAAGQEQPIVIK